jgi:hypothetical protein
MRKPLVTAAVAALIAGSAAAFASGPSQFNGIPSDYHVGEASCVFTVTGQVGFMGVPSDGQHAAQCFAIVQAFNNGRTIGWAVFSPGQTVPCDPDFCNEARTATRVTNVVGVPLGN